MSNGGMLLGLPNASEKARSLESYGKQHNSYRVISTTQDAYNTVA